MISAEDEKKMLEPIDNQYFLIGHIAQSHGVDGAVLIIPDRYLPTLFDAVDLVHLQDNSGELVPARVESVRVQEKNDRLSFFVKFDHITDRNEANRLKSFLIYVARKKVEHLLEDKAVQDFTSFEIMDENGLQVGVVEEIIDNPAQSILSVQTGEGRLLIPVVDEYVAKVDEEHEVIYCQNLDQLSDL